MKTRKHMKTLIRILPLPSLIFLGFIAGCEDYT